MKKIILAILALIYITTSTGIAIRTHYCMGELADWGLGSGKSNICSTCGMKESDEKENGCCKEKHTLIKNTTDQKFTGTVLIMIPVFSVALPSCFIEAHSNNFLSITRGNPANHAPLRSRGVAVYIRNCVFLI